MIIFSSGYLANRSRFTRLTHYDLVIKVTAANAAQISVIAIHYDRRPLGVNPDFKSRRQPKDGVLSLPSAQGLMYCLI